jgi:hypothetical protein
MFLLPYAQRMVSLQYYLQLKAVDLDIKKKDILRGFIVGRFSVHEIQAAASVWRTSDVTKRSGTAEERSHFVSFCLAIRSSSNTLSDFTKIIPSCISRPTGDRGCEHVM